jgi:general stress protein YciG
MSPEKRREIASKGGKSIPAAKRTFSMNKTLASEAGRKGGKSVAPANRTFTHNLELAKAAGSKGGKAPRRAKSE